MNLQVASTSTVFAFRRVHACVYTYDPWTRNRRLPCVSGCPVAGTKPHAVCRNSVGVQGFVDLILGNPRVVGSFGVDSPPQKKI